MSADDLVFVESVSSSTVISTVTNDSDDLDIIYKTSEPSFLSERKSDRIVAEDSMHPDTLIKQPTTEPSHDAQMLPLGSASVNEESPNTKNQATSHRTNLPAPPAHYSYYSPSGKVYTQYLPSVGHDPSLTMNVADYSM